MPFEPISMSAAIPGVAMRTASALPLYNVHTIQLYLTTVKIQGATVIVYAQLCAYCNDSPILRLGDSTSIRLDTLDTARHGSQTRPRRRRTAAARRRSQATQRPNQRRQRRQRMRHHENLQFSDSSSADVFCMQCARRPYGEEVVLHSSRHTWRQRARLRRITRAVRNGDMQATSHFRRG